METRDPTGSFAAALAATVVLLGLPAGAQPTAGAKTASPPPAEQAAAPASAGSAKGTAAPGEPATGEGEEGGGEPAAATAAGSAEEQPSPMEAAAAWIAAAEKKGQQPSTPDEGDRMGWSVASHTYLRLFKRAALPGPNGAVVEPRFNVPIYEYASLRVVDIDVPWQRDAIDVELSAWGNVTIGDLAVDGGAEHRRVDGDVTVLSVRHRLGPAYLQLGRQQYAGGAARFVRFDGLSAGVRAPFGLGADAYGGFAVLPRWNQVLGYHLLGSSAEVLSRSPDALPDPNRGNYWLAGGRAYYSLVGYGELGVSLHEEHGGAHYTDPTAAPQDLQGLARRDLGADLRVTPIDEIALQGQGRLDLDSIRPSDIRASADVYPIEDLSLSGEYRYAEPALLLPRYSVLSVFATDPYNEVGGFAGYRPVSALSLGGGGYVDIFEQGRAGWRAKGRVRLRPLGDDSLVMRLGYTRYTGPLNGYHALRAAVGYQVVDPLRLTADSYNYFYDEPIDDVSAAWVGALSGEVSTGEAWAALLSGSLAVTPYAKTDSQLMARLRLNFAGGTR